MTYFPNLTFEELNQLYARLVQHRMELQKDYVESIDSHPIDVEELKDAIDKLQAAENVIKSEIDYLTAQTV